MKIAVTYEDGNVFPHFGRTKQFKVYNVEENRVISTEMLDCGDVGHEALAGLLLDNDVNVLICGGMGSGAQEALIDAGITPFSGAEGDADLAVQCFLDGALESEGINCDHHDHEDGMDDFGDDFEEGCGGGCGGCSGSCGSCGGGCGGGMRPVIEGPNAGKIVRVDYRGTFNDGTVFDSSYDHGEPLQFICGSGVMIPGFDKAVANMAVGEKQSIHLMPEDAYGPYDPNAVFSVDVNQLPGSEDLLVGQQVYLTNVMGQPFPATVTEREGSRITFDANHEMAGKELNFEIELKEIIE